jgi:hypothetical protein
MKAQLTLISKESLLILAGVLVAFYTLLLSVENRMDAPGGLLNGTNDVTYNTK